ncbi:MAG: DUF2309 domain-containing protein [Planctomycetaceae bacterium]
MTVLNADHPSATDATTDRIRRTVAAAAEFLPSQGPITAFTMLNPMAALEGISFDEAQRQVPEIYGCRPYLPESAYRRMLQQGRVSEHDLREVLLHELSYSATEIVAGLIPRVEFRVSVLQNSLLSGDDAELHWLLMETDVLSKFRPETSEENRTRLIAESRHWIAGRADITDNRELQNALRRARSSQSDSTDWEAVCLKLMWHDCCQGVGSVPLIHPPTTNRIRCNDLLKQVTGADADDLVNDVLIRFCAGFLDQGFAGWPLPDRNAGFLNAFCRLNRSGQLLQPAWLSSLKSELRRLQSTCDSPAEWIIDSLESLGVPSDAQEDYLRATLLALRGYAGMLWQTEVRPDRVHVPSPPGTLLEFVAVRLLLDRLAVEFLAQQSMSWNRPLSELQSKLQSQLSTHQTISNEQYAYRIFQCAQVNGWGPSTLAALKKSDWKELIQELAQFSEHERQRVFHIAFERRYACEAMDAVIARVSRPPVKPTTPLLQVSCCIDAREESFRRHIEEVSPDVQTYGAAGFYGIPMYYRGLGDAHFTALCPVIVKPTYWVVEEPVYSMEEVARAKARARKALGTAGHRILEATNRSVGGAFVSALLGPLATAPLVGYTVFPRATAKLHTAASHFVAPPQVSRLRLERDEAQAPGCDDDGLGFTVAEMAKLGGKLLRDIGLTDNFAPIVLFLGHGSSCLNNPHKSAYHCGACSGGSGGPNARTMAAMLNDTRVRRLLAQEGLHIPDETYVLGGLHNTGTDEITFYDLELLPSQHTKYMQQIRDILSRACERNAQERCRRFESADFDIEPGPAMNHVQDRSQNLAETRPEYGNCTNAMCFVGRRERVRGLFMDRRSFLQSYDPTTDDAAHGILAGVLGAVIPVCEGINLLYTLSAMDSQGWGAGSKLPHNATSMLGVMDGSASDLRAGLPWQGVDIHEPMRLLFIIETTPQAMLSIMDRNSTIDRICRGNWVQLAVLDPESSEIKYFSGGRFVLHEPQRRMISIVEQSTDWYRGSRDHLPFAIVGERN